MAVSLDVFTKADEYVLDLAQFQQELWNFVCGEPMTLHFKSNYSYSLAVDAWSWVNGNASRAFILAEDHPACARRSGGVNKRRPWVVTDFEDLGNYTVVLNAIEKTWKEVLHTYDIKFGDSALKALKGRQLDWSHTFSVPLAQSFPHQIINATFDNAAMEIVCDSCGTKGSLNIEGEIAADILHGLTKFQLTTRPSGIEVDINLEYNLWANLTLLGLDPYEHQQTLLDLPLGEDGIVIEGLLTIGPNLQINFGVKVDSYEGTAKIIKPHKATISDDSYVIIDFLHPGTVEVYDWVPQFSSSGVQARPGSIRPLRYSSRLLQLSAF